MSERLNRIDEIIGGEISNGNIAGASVRAIYKGSDIYRKSFGYADRENNIPMTDDTIFRMFSMTKPITAAAAMLLLERGMIELAYPVKWFVKSFESPMVEDENGVRPAERDVTVRDLLSMTSGICYPDEWSPAGRKMTAVFDEIKRRNNNDSPLSTAETAELIGKCPLAFTPGKCWMYGASADVLGAVIEAVSGKRFSEFIRQEILDPLEMNDTGFYLPQEKYSRLAQIYEQHGNAICPYTDLYLGLTDYSRPPAFESGGAGLVSTVSDYSNFASMLLNNGTYKGRKILGRKTVQLMKSNLLNDEQLKTVGWDSMAGYGYGSFMRILLDKTIGGYNFSEGEFGWDGWTGNYFSIDPSEDLIFLYFIQKTYSGCTDVTRKIKSVIYSEI